MQFYPRKDIGLFLYLLQALKVIIAFLINIFMVCHHYFFGGLRSGTGMRGIVPAFHSRET